MTRKNNDLEKARPVPLAEQEAPPPELAAMAALLREAGQPNPPLGARQRVWRRLQEELTPAPDLAGTLRTRWLRWPAYAAAAAALAAITIFAGNYYFAKLEAANPTIAAAPGAAPAASPAPATEGPSGPRQVLGFISSGALETATQPEPVFSGIAIAVPPGQPRQLKLVNGIAVRVEAATQFKVVALAGGGTRLDLDNGGLTLEVEPRGDRPPVVAATPEATVTVVGTAFHVRRPAVGLSQIVVYQGRVKLEAGQSLEFADAGQCGEARSGGGGVTLRVEQCARLVGAEWQGVPLTRPAFAALEPAAPEAGKKKIAAAPKARAPEETMPGPASLAPAPPAAPRDPWLALQSALVTAAPEQRLREINSLLRADPRQGDRPEVLAALADAHKSANNPGEARRIYGRIIELSPTGLWAENALYEIGFLSLFRLREPEQAIQAWRDYQIRFPTGAFREEVDFQIAEAFLARKQYAGALGELRRFVDSYVTSARRPDALFLLATLQREHQRDCTLAAATYESFLAVSRNEKRLEEAMYWRAACLEVTGQRPPALHAYRDYLNRFPAGRYAAQATAALNSRGD